MDNKGNENSDGLARGMALAGVALGIYAAVKDSKEEKVTPPAPVVSTSGMTRMEFTVPGELRWDYTQSMWAYVDYLGQGAFQVLPYGYTAVLDDGELVYTNPVSEAYPLVTGAAPNRSVAGFWVPPMTVVGLMFVEVINPTTKPQFWPWGVEASFTPMRATGVPYQLRPSGNFLGFAGVMFDMQFGGLVIRPRELISDVANRAMDFNPIILNYCLAQDQFDTAEVILAANPGDLARRDDRAAMAYLMRKLAGVQADLEIEELLPHVNDAGVKVYPTLVSA